jgi:hypothetical protein
MTAARSLSGIVAPLVYLFGVLGWGLDLVRAMIPAAWGDANDSYTAHCG